MARWTDLSRRYWKALGIPQRVPRLADTVIPVIVLDELTDPPSTEPTKFRPWVGSISVAAAAASPSTIQIYNPTHSGKLVIVERIIWCPTASCRVYGLAALCVSVGNCPLNNAGTTVYVQPLDNRVRDLVATVLSGSNDAGAVVQVTAKSLNLGCVADYEHKLNFVLDQGQALAFSTTANNLNLGANVFGREIPRIV